MPLSSHPLSFAFPAFRRKSSVCMESPRNVWHVCRPFRISQYVTEPSAIRSRPMPIVRTVCPDARCSESTGGTESLKLRTMSTCGADTSISAIVGVRSPSCCVRRIPPIESCAAVSRNIRRPGCRFASSKLSVVRTMPLSRHRPADRIETHPVDADPAHSAGLLGDLFFDLLPDDPADPEVCARKQQQDGDDDDPRRPDDFSETRFSFGSFHNSVHFTNKMHSLQIPVQIAGRWMRYSTMRIICRRFYSPVLPLRCP